MTNVGGGVNLDILARGMDSRSEKINSDSLVRSRGEKSNRQSSDDSFANELDQWNGSRSTSSRKELYRKDRKESLNRSGGEKDRNQTESAPSTQMMTPSSPAAKTEVRGNEVEISTRSNDNEGSTRSVDTMSADTSAAIDGQYGNVETRGEKDEKGITPSPMLGADKTQRVSAKALSPKEKIMNEFISTMNQEFGVGPQKVVDAFARLDQATLVGDPDEAVGQFVDNLGIADDQKPKAAVIYRDMVAKTGSEELEGQLVGESPKAVQFEILSQKDKRIKGLNEGIDDMNSKFFGFKQGIQGTDLSNNGPFESLNSLPMNRAMTNGASFENGLKTDKKNLSLQKDLSSEGDLPRGKDLSLNAQSIRNGLPIQPEEMSAMIAALMKEKSQSRLEKSDADEKIDSDLVIDPSHVDSLADESVRTLDGIENQNQLPFANQQDSLNNLTAVIQNAPSETTKPINRSSLASQKLEKSNQDVGKNGDKDSFFGKTEKQADDGKSSELASSTGLGATQSTKGDAKTGPDAMMLNRQSTPKDEAENVKELVKQAQLMIKRGGGEMKLEMKPEGMGQVHLHVKVNNGQVDIQMLTENDTAKKALERGLSELKDNLAAHQLKVESMKVDVGSDIKKHMESNQDQAREQARQFAQDFMGSFRDERQGFRQGFMENSAWKSYGRPQGRANMEPEKVESLAAARQKQMSATRKLNLVA